MLVSTLELRTQLRELIDEIVPAGQHATATRFTDAQLDSLISAATHINQAAVAGWRSKAARAMSERGGIEESQAGDERHKFVSIEIYRDHCMAMVEVYNKLVPNIGSRAMSYCLPPFGEVLQ